MFVVFTYLFRFTTLKFVINVLYVTFVVNEDVATVWHLQCFYVTFAVNEDVATMWHLQCFYVTFALHEDVATVWHLQCFYVTFALNEDVATMWHLQCFYVTFALNEDVATMWHLQCFYVTFVVNEDVATVWYLQCFYVTFAVNEDVATVWHLQCFYVTFAVNEDVATVCIFGEQYLSVVYFDTLTGKLVFYAVSDTLKTTPFLFVWSTAVTWESVIVDNIVWRRHDKFINSDDVLWQLRLLVVICSRWTVYTCYLGLALLIGCNHVRSKTRSSLSLA